MSKCEEIKYAMESRATVCPDQISKSDLRDAGCLDRVFVVPEEFNERVSYLSDALVQMLSRKPVDDNLRFVVGQLCQSLSYMVNSTSWREGQLYDFDLDELRRKLGRLGCKAAESEGERSETIRERNLKDAFEKERDYRKRLESQLAEQAEAAKKWDRHGISLRSIGGDQ